MVSDPERLTNNHVKKEAYIRRAFPLLDTITASHNLFRNPQLALHRRTFLLFFQPVYLSP